MNHTINVRLIDERVHADPNPLPRRPLPGVPVRSGDAVAWLFDRETVGDKVLTVEFQAVVGLDPETGKPKGSPTSTNSFGPFTSFERSLGIVGPDVPQDIRQAKRYLYKILDENGNPLVWDNPVPGQPADFGGGIDIPMTPP